jgi:GNAT superfamily N-acetyltransferase
MTLALRCAEEGDIGAIVQLVNAAYRPEPGSAGWTHEGHLVAGPRVTAAMMRTLFVDRSVILLLAQGPQIMACVHVKAAGDVACLGMFATDPALQATGLGKAMLQHAESHARSQFGSRLFRMSVLSVRQELLAFYQRRGYGLTGESEEFHPEGGISQPRVEGLQLLRLEKQA